MIPNWTNHLSDKDEIKRFKQHIYSSRSVLERLSDILKVMETDLENQELDTSSYESPSWAARQADTNGFRRCLRKVQKLITLDQKDK